MPKGAYITLTNKLYPKGKKSAFIEDYKSAMDLVENAQDNKLSYLKIPLPGSHRVMLIQGKLLRHSILEYQLILSTKEKLSTWWKSLTEK